MQPAPPKNRNPKKKRKKFSKLARCIALEGPKKNNSKEVSLEKEVSAQVVGKGYVPLDPS
jgi:hypothetical protein